MEYNIAYYDKILPRNRETLVTLIKFLFDYIEELGGELNEES